MRKANAAISILGVGLALLLAWAPAAGADTYTYTYNAADQLTSLQGPNGAASYTYDGDGQRITRSTASGQTIYVRDPQGEVIAEYSATGALLAEYVYVDGQRLCKITHDAQGVERRVYYHQDVVGTPVAETDESGQVLVRANYTPFGEEVIPGAASDPHKFTGKELDDESGLTYFGARYYDAHLGRFVSVDEADGDNTHPQSWNRYAYALNNPLRYEDPNGDTALEAVYGFAQGVLGSMTFGTLPHTAPVSTDAPDQRAGQNAGAAAVAAAGVDLAQTGITTGAAAAVAELATAGAASEVAVPAAAVGAAEVIAGAAALSGATVYMAKVTNTSAQGAYKSPKAGLSGKEGAKDVPSWVKGQRPKIGESGKDFAKRLLDEKYGQGNWTKGGGSEFSKIQKWGDRSFE
jgi:RHS repeat-associated protein